MTEKINIARGRRKVKTSSEKKEKISANKTNLKKWGQGL